MNFLARRETAVALLLGAFFCAPVLQPATAETKPTCKVPNDITRLDRPLTRIGLKLQAHEAVKIIAIGSSSTAGAGASSPSASYPARLEADLKTRFPGTDITVINRGVNGEIAPQMLARFDTEVIPEKPDLVLWQVGSNSVLREDPINPTADVIRDGVKRLRAAGVDVVLINLQYSQKILAKRDFEGMVHLIDVAAKELNVNVFRRFSVMQHWHVTRELPFDTFVTADGIHMNDWGYDCWAKLLGGAVAEASTRPTASASVAPALAAPVVPASSKPAP